jgi:hypothetical protein
MASSRGILNIQSLNELTSENRRLGASRAIPDRPARARDPADIVGSSTKYAVRRFDNRHIHDKQTSRIMMRIESIEA